MTLDGRMRVVLACLFALLIGSCAQPAERGPVVVAAASLQGALDEVADEWARQGHARPVISYAGSQALARQVEAGAPADVVFLADHDWMDRLASGGFLAPGSRRDVIANRLVIVQPVESPGVERVRLATVLASGRIAMGEPETVPAGRHGKEALQSENLWDEIAGRVVPAENVRAALALAERGEVGAAVVYASDAAASTEVRVAAVLPEFSHRPIRYPAALLASSQSAETAGFLNFLSSPAAEPIFARHGFTPLSASD